MRPIHFRTPQRTHQHLDAPPRFHHGSRHRLLLLPLKRQLQHVNKSRHFHSRGLLLRSMQVPSLLHHLAHDEQHLAPNAPRALRLRRLHGHLAPCGRLNHDDRIRSFLLRTRLPLVLHVHHCAPRHWRRHPTLAPDLQPRRHGLAPRRLLLLSCPHGFLALWPTRIHARRSVGSVLLRTHHEEPARVHYGRLSVR